MMTQNSSTLLTNTTSQLLHKVTTQRRKQNVTKYVEADVPYDATKCVQGSMNPSVPWDTTTGIPRIYQGG